MRRFGYNGGLACLQLFAKVHPMGATLWYHAAPWHPDPGDALEALQASFLAENYQVAEFLRERLASFRRAVEAEKADGDRYSILDDYQEQVDALEPVCSRPMPTDPHAQIELIRLAERGSGQGIGNVLDLTGISIDREPLMAQRLGEPELARLVGASRPSLATAQTAIDRIHTELNRGECVCFPFYDADTGKPAGWYFVGNTID